jgi:hypothetical protein
MVQPHLINQWIRKLQKETIGTRIGKIPGIPRFKIQQPTKDMEVLDTDQQKKYHYGVEVLLYLTKYSRPNISSVVREFSRCMDGTTWGAYHEIVCH